MRFINQLKVSPKRGRFSFMYLAQWVAHDTGCIGAAIGIITLAPVPMLQTANADSIIPYCETINSLPEGVRAFASMLCAVQQGIFADGSDPSLAFRFIEAVDSPGTYEGTDGYSRVVSFEAVQVLTLPLYESHPEDFTSSDAGYFCIGWIKGPAGSVPVAAICIRKESITGDPITSAFLVTELMTDFDVLACAQSERIAAGLIPEVADNDGTADTTHGQSIPEDEGNGSTLATKATDELVLVTSTSHSDLIGATLGQSASLPWSHRDCVRIALLHFNIDDFANRRTLTDCITNVLDNLSLSFIGCSASGVIGAFFGPLGALGGYGTCMLLAEGICAVQTASCHSTFKNAQNANAAHLAQDLAACAQQFPQTTQPLPQP